MTGLVFFKGISYSYIKQLIILMTGIFSLPLLISYLGIDTYSIWVLVVGLAGYLNTLSFGIPSAMNALVASANNDAEKYGTLKKSVSILSVISFIMSFLLSALLFFDNNWVISLLGNIKEEHYPIAKTMFVCFVFFTLIRLPLNLYSQFFTGMNLVFISEIYQIYNSVLSFTSIFVAYYFELPVLSFILLWFSSQLILNVISVFHVFIKYRYVKQHELKVTNSKIIISGVAFFQVGIAAVIVWSTDNLIISHFLSVDDVAPYAIVFKLFTYFFMFSAVLNGVVSPIYGNAVSENDWGKIYKLTSILHKVLPVLGGSVWLFLILFAKEIVVYWTGRDDLFGGYLLVFSFGAYGYILSYINTYATLTFSLNQAKSTTKIAWSEAILNLFLSIFLINFFSIGGVALATVISALITGFIFFPRLLARITDGKIIYDFTYLKKQFLFLVLPSVSISLLLVGYAIYIKIFFLFVILSLYFIGSWVLLGNKEKNELINFRKIFK